MGAPKKSRLVAVCRPVIAALIKLHGTRHRADITNGVRASARVWNFRKEGYKTFAAFCRRQYVPPGAGKSALLKRLDHLWNTLSGSMTIITKEMRAGLDLADNPLTPAEELLSGFTAASHLSEDYRRFHIAQLVQLNFGTDRRDIPTTREGWAARRLSKWGREVIPARLRAEASRMQAKVDQFVFGYNLHLDRFDFGDPDIVFPPGTRLISHWGLRDYMMQQYDAPQGLKKQRAILQLMRRVVDGAIPVAVLDNPQVHWHIPQGTLSTDGETRPARGHGALRWAHFRKLFQVHRKIDPYTHYGNMIDAKFLEEREMEESRVRKILTDILGSTVGPQVGTYLEKRLGRPLEPFDIYFKQFLSGHQKAPLDYDLTKRFANAEALQSAIPQILEQLGFAGDLARWIGSHVRVDNSRSAGHAWSPGTPHDMQLLRVRIPSEGVSEIEFSTFMHELGHCVEGVLTTYRMDYRSLWHVPNTALTEAFAFTFQDRADDVLGRQRTADPHLTMLQRFWEVFEIAGPALAEMEFFHWLYAHPRATPEQMQHAIRAIADRIWAKYHAQIFGKEGYGLLAVYSHILWCDLYLPDYPLGYVCAYQIRRFLRDKNLGVEMPRMCAAGKIDPDEWMRRAVGSPIDADPLLTDTAQAIRTLTGR